MERKRWKLKFQDKAGSPRLGESGAKDRREREKE